MKTMSYLAVTVLLVSRMPLFAASSASHSPAEASRLLREVRTLAHSLDRDAATLDSYRLKGISWQGHAYRLGLAREQINAIGERLESIQAMQSSVAPWQQEAIDSIVPVAVQLAARTEAAINYLNENQGKLFVPDYTDHLEAIAGHADEMKESVGVFLELASAQEKMNTFRGLA